MVLRSSYTQSVFSVYSIYTEDIIERYLIKSVNVSGGSASRTGREVDRCNGRVLIKILAIEKKILPLLKVKNIVLIRDAIIEYGDCRVRMSP